MPKNQHAKREQKREAMRCARDAESPEVRAARLASDAAHHAELRAAETEDEHCNRLADNAALQARLRDTASPEVRAARLTSDAARHAELRAAETDEERRNWRARNAATLARLRDKETPQQQVERQAKDALSHQEIRHACLEQAHKNNCNLARCDDTDFFQEELYGDFTHTLSITSLFECPTCVHCNAYVWKEERKGFCCMSGKIDLSYNPTNPKPGSIPPRPPNAIKDLFQNQNFVKEAKQYNNALAMASIGIRKIAIPGFNPGVRMQGKVTYIASPLPEQGQMPLFA